MLTVAYSSSSEELKKTILKKARMVHAIAKIPFLNHPKATFRFLEQHSMKVDREGKVFQVMGYRKCLAPKMSPDFVNKDGSAPCSAEEMKRKLVSDDNLRNLWANSNTNNDCIRKGEPPIMSEPTKPFIVEMNQTGIRVWTHLSSLVKGNAFDGNGIKLREQAWEKFKNGEHYTPLLPGWVQTEDEEGVHFWYKACEVTDSNRHKVSGIYTDHPFPESVTEIRPNGDEMIVYDSLKGEGDEPHYIY